MACRLAGLSRAAYRRPLNANTTADPDRALRAWLRAWAKTHPRYGYRRAYHDARAERWVVNHKNVQRLWRDEGLRVPQRRRRKRVGSSTVDAPSADAPMRKQPEKWRAPSPKDLDYETVWLWDPVDALAGRPSVRLMTVKEWLTRVRGAAVQST